LILKIAGERSANVNTKVRGVPAAFYPFIAGPRNSFAQSLEENNGVQVRVPPHRAWASQYAPSAAGPGQRPVFVPASDDNHIQLAGDRAAVQAARAAIERRVEELQRQLELEQLSIQRGRHQFIIGNRGVPEDQFFEETGCAILLPTDEDDDTVTIIGPPESIQAGLEKAMDLATSMQCSNIDISRFHRQAGAAHARNVTRYLRERKEIERLEKQYNVHFNTPFTSEGASPWELYSRDGKAAIRAQSEIKGIVDSHPPARMSTVPVDPFFHQYLRNEINSRVRDQYGVHLVIPDSNDGEAPVLLVFEGPSGPDAPYQVPRSQPSQAEIRNFEQGLDEARRHILGLIEKQEQLASVSIDVPQKYHDKLRRFIKKEQADHPTDQIPVRVSSLRETVTFRGPRSAVESLAEKSRAFVQQEKEDEKERGFTLDFDFPQKFANHLIGKGGSNIRELRDKFDVDIQVQDGKVQLRGPQKKAESAKAHILTLGKQLADETTHILKVDPKFHRELIGAGGSQINRLQTRYKVLIFFPRSGKNSKDDESVADGASEMGKAKRQQAPDEVIVRGPKKGADEARDEILSLLQYLKDNSFTATVSVQQKQLPSLIGQGGSGMEQLRQATGAKIDIPNGRDVPEGTLVDITIKGTKDQVAAAKKILEEKRSVFDDTVVRTLEVDKKYHKALIGAGGK
jgi:rRNA processing protein Krr1/Pno1